MDPALDADLIHDSEPEREAERVRKRARRTARRESRRQAADDSTAGSTSTLTSGLDDSDEIQEIGSSFRTRSQQGTTSAYFGKGKAKTNSVDPAPTATRPLISRASSSSSAVFPAPCIPKADPAAAEDFIYAHAPWSSPPMPAPVNAREPSFDDPFGEPIDAAPPNPFDNAELQRIKECPLCKEDWNQLRKLSKTKWSHMLACKPSTSVSSVVQAVRDRLNEKRPGFSRASSTASRSKRSTSVSLSEVSDSSRRIMGRKPEAVELSESDDDDSDRAPRRSITTPATGRSAEAPESCSPFRSPSPAASGQHASFDGQQLSPPPRLDLSRFAHEGSAGSSSKAPTSANLSRKPSSIKKLPVKVPDAPVQPDILRKLKQCILCGEDWTTKSRIGRTKWDHTFKCSQALPEPLSLLRLGELMEEAVMPPPPTLLDSVVPHRKKPARKGSAVESSIFVAGSELGREAIMDRVGQVLGELIAGPSNAADDEMQPPPFPSTQTFSTSGLGARFGAGRGSRVDSWTGGPATDQASAPLSPPLGNGASAQTPLASVATSLRLSRHSSSPSSDDSIVFLSESASSALPPRPRTWSPLFQPSQSAVSGRPSSRLGSAAASSVAGAASLTSPAHNDRSSGDPLAPPFPSASSLSTHSLLAGTIPCAGPLYDLTKDVLPANDINDRSFTSLSSYAQRSSSSEVLLSERPSRGGRLSTKLARSPSPEWSDDGVLHWEGDTGYAVDVSMSGDESIEGAELDAAAAVAPMSAPALRSTPRPKGKGRAPPSMPEYDSMTIKQLQTKVKSFGFKPSAQHAQLVRLCADIWRTMHPDRSSPPVAAPSPTKDVGRTPRAKAIRRKGSKTATARSPSPIDVPTVASETGAEPWGELGDRFRQMILDDEEVWLRILRYKPLSFDELVSMGHQAGIKTKGWRNTLKLWLDDQSITFYSEEQSGCRQRYP